MTANGNWVVVGVNQPPHAPCSAVLATHKTRAAAEADAKERNRTAGDAAIPVWFEAHPKDEAGPMRGPVKAAAKKAPAKKSAATPGKAGEIPTVMEGTPRLAEEERPKPRAPRKRAAKKATGDGPEALKELLRL